MVKSNGKLIVVEGCEGAGKSLQCNRLKDALAALGINAIVTREPGGVPLSEQLRKIILSPKYNPDAVTELFLFAAARREHVNAVILPAISRGVTVICDRFTYSTLAYQGYGGGVDLDLIRAVNAAATCPVKTDIALFIDVTPECGFNRKGGADGGDRMENSGAEFFARVYRGFKELCKTDGLTAVDGNGSADDVSARILNAVKGVF